ncbi:MAG: lipopolysaccharide kinase InaA family protein [Pseudomonadota bacterium]
MSSPRPSELPVTAAALVQMGRHPGPFMLALDGQAGAAACVSCDVSVRAIPGRRLVCRGAWQGLAVYTKVYMGPDKYWQAEVRGLQALNRNGIAAPAVLHAGTADNGALHIIVLEAVEPAQTLALAWEQASDEAARIKLLKLAVSTIARHHQAGLEQCDIHLDNFLLSDERLYTLDGGGIRPPGDTELSFRRSRDNLAQFFAQFYPRFDELIEAVLPDYVSQRSWSEGRLSGVGLLQRVRFFRYRRQRHFLKKIFRECSAFICRKSWFGFRVYDRELASPGLLDLLADPDASLQQPDARYLKQGNTCTLWSVAAGGQQLVVKRYNIKGAVHRISRAFRRTRAATSWKNAHRLAMYGILSARPVALYERRFGPLRGKAWLVMEYLGGDDIMQLCEQPRPDNEATLISDTTALLAQLAQCRISHGDMKGTNFIQSPRGIAVIDLDSMCEHDSDADFRRSQQRDLRRFMRNWRDCPDIEAQFRESMQHNKLVTES